MLKAMLNQLRLEMMEKLDLREKIELVKKLKAAPYNMSYGDIQKRTGLAKSTMHRWMTQPIGSLANKYFNVDNYLFAKMRMLKNYESQVKKYGLGWVKAIEGLAKFRGYIANCTYAESVQVIKEVDN